MVRHFRFAKCLAFKFLTLSVDLMRRSKSSRPKVFCKKCVLKNFTKFKGKNLAVLRPSTLLKKRLWHRCFPVNFAKILRTLSFVEHLWWLLSKVTGTWIITYIGLYILYLCRPRGKYQRIPKTKEVRVEHIEILIPKFYGFWDTNDLVKQPIYLGTFNVKIKD